MVGNTHNYHTVLLARFSALGDVAMTVPAVYSACRGYPDVHFVFVTRPSMTSIFVDAPANLTVVGVDVKETYDGITGLSTSIIPTYSSTYTTCCAPSSWRHFCG